jgi:small-conductance mechanosensitive channel
LAAQVGDGSLPSMDAAAVARVARPYLGKAALALFIALAGLVVASGGEGDANLVDRMTQKPVTAGDFVAVAGGVVFIVAGVIAIRIFTRGTGKAIEQPLGDARTNTLTLIISIVGHSALVLAALNLLGVPLDGLLLGGAITGVVLGIAAQQTLGNVFAGLVLLIVRPFVVGDEVVLKSGSLGGEYAGRIVDMGLFYVDMMTETGPVKLPNAGVLAGAVGPGARSSKEAAEEEEPPEPLAADTSEGGAPEP